MARKDPGTPFFGGKPPTEAEIERNAKKIAEATSPNATPKTFGDFLRAVSEAEDAIAVAQDKAQRARADYEASKNRNPSRVGDAKLRQAAQSAEREVDRLESMMKAKSNLYDRLNSASNRLTGKSSTAFEAVLSDKTRIEHEIAQSRGYSSYKEVPTRKEKAEISRQAVHDAIQDKPAERINSMFSGSGVDKKKYPELKNMGKPMSGPNWNVLQGRGNFISNTAVNAEHAARNLGHEALDKGSQLIKEHGVKTLLPGAMLIAAGAFAGSLATRKKPEAKRPDKEMPHKYGEILASYMFMNSPTVDSVHRDGVMKISKPKRIRRGRHKPIMSSSAPVINNFPDVKPDVRSYSDEMLESVVQLSWANAAKERFSQIGARAKELWQSYIKKAPEYYHAVMLPLGPIAAAVAIKSNMDLNKSIKQAHKTEPHKYAEPTEAELRARYRRYKKEKNKKKRTNEFVAIEGATGLALYSLINGINKAKDKEKERKEAEEQRKRDNTLGIIASRLNDKK